MKSEKFASVLLYCLVLPLFIMCSVLSLCCVPSFPYAVFRPFFEDFILALLALYLITSIRPISFSATKRYRSESCGMLV